MFRGRVGTVRLLLDCGCGLDVTRNICGARANAHVAREMQVFSITVPTEDGDELSIDLFVQQSDAPTDALL